MGQLSSMLQFNMDIFNQIATGIIKEQALIIGPLAWVEARKVKGLEVIDKQAIVVATDKKSAIDNLVTQYQRLFGLVSKEVCRKAVKNLITKLTESDIPITLK